MAAQNYMVLKTKSDTDDEEPDFKLQPNTVKIIPPTGSDQNTIKRHTRKNFLNEYYVSLKEDLGSGGFGNVFIAHSKPIGPLRVKSEQYAIKKIQFEQREREVDFHDNFRINSRFVVRVLDFWFDDFSTSPSTKCMFIKMELCGENLRKGLKRLRESYETPASQVATPGLAVFILNIFQELLMACFVLHNDTRFSIVDLKPENVLFGMTGIKLCDFGLMTFTNPTGVGANQALVGGTSLYQPPNLFVTNSASNKQIITKLDMYAMGLILLEMFYSTNSIAELKITFENIKSKRELPKQLKDEWPEVCEIILSLTQNELDKIDSAQEAIFKFNKLWEKDVFRHVDFPDSPITITNGTPFLQESVNMWKETFNVMQQCSWRFCSRADNFSRMFTLAGQKQKDNFLCVSSVSLGIAHIGFLRLKQLVDNNVSYDQIARELKQLYDKKHGKYWHCFVSDDEDTTFKVFRNEFVYLGYCFGKKSVEAYLCTSRYVGLNKLKERAREIKVIQDKRNISKNNVNKFIKEKFVAFLNQGKEYKNDGDYNEDFANFLSAELISAYGNQWNCIVGRNIFHCITGQYSGAVLQHTFNGREIVVFKMKKEPLVQFDHSTYATICQRLGIPANWRVELSDQLPEEHLPVEDILRILEIDSIRSELTDRKWPDMPLQIICHHGCECSYNEEVTVCLLACGPQFKMSMSIWMTEPAECVQITENFGETILREIKENKFENIASEIRSYMIKNHGGEWFCLVADTNGFQFVIYHNGNLFNFLVGDLEIVLYQPGLEKFKSNYVEETDPNNVTYDDT